MINIRDIKDLDPKDALYNIKKYHFLFEDLGIKENSPVENEEREMVLIVKFIKCGFLEKQLKAIDEIKNLILFLDPINESKFIFCVF